MNYEHWRNYARGWVFHFLGREDRAFEAFGTAFRVNPKDVRSARHLAAIAASRKDYAVAEKWFEAALALSPGDGPNWFNLGFVREAEGKPKQAIAAFNEAVRLVPVQDRAWYGMGLAYARLGQHAEAISALEKVVELQPMSSEGFYQLGMAYHHANRPDDVTKILKRLVGFEPKRARKLAHDTERADLMKFIPELPF
jgi:tetratricopeptide (TPR) repeat protein